MQRHDPVADAMTYEAEREERMREWLDLRPICASCQEPIGMEEYYDLSDDANEEDFVFCRTCMNYWFDHPDTGNVMWAVKELITENYRRTMK